MPRLLALALILAAPAFARPYGVTLIPPPEGADDTFVAAMNASGHVVGDYTPPAGGRRAFVFRTGQSVALPLPPNAVTSGASGINAAGIIVGHHRDNSSIRACVWDGDSVTTLPSPADARDVSATAINDAGLIVGRYTDTNFVTHVCIWQSGSLVYPTKPMGTTDFSEAVAVGTDGKFVGNVRTAAGFRATQWNSAANVTLLPLPAGATTSRVGGINGVGLAVGYASSMTTTQACLWQGSVVDVLPTPGTGGSEAAAVNSFGQVVGNFIPEGVMASRAWIWETGTPAFLPTSVGVVSSSAVAINDAGRIAVNFTFADGRGRAALLAQAFQPTIRISGRKAITTSKRRIVVRGTTTDFVDRVAWRAGRRRGAAQGTRAWRFTYRAKPGRNVVRVTATGPGGQSAPARLVIVRR